MTTPRIALTLIAAALVCSVAPTVGGLERARAEGAVEAQEKPEATPPRPTKIGSATLAKEAEEFWTFLCEEIAQGDWNKYLEHRTATRGTAGITPTHLTRTMREEKKGVVSHSREDLFVTEIDKKKRTLTLKAGGYRTGRGLVFDDKPTEMGFKDFVEKGKFDGDALARMFQYSATGKVSNHEDRTRQFGAFLAHCKQDWEANAVLTAYVAMVTTERAVIHEFLKQLHGWAPGEALAEHVVGRARYSVPVEKGQRELVTQQLLAEHERRAAAEAAILGERIEAGLALRDTITWQQVTEPKASQPHAYSIEYMSKLIDTFQVRFAGTKAWDDMAKAAEEAAKETNAKRKAEMLKGNLADLRVRVKAASDEAKKAFDDARKLLTEAQAATADKKGSGSATELYAKAEALMRTLVPGPKRKGPFLAPNDDNNYFELGELLYKLCEPDPSLVKCGKESYATEALEYFEIALTYHPDNFPIMLRKARALMACRRNKAARELCTVISKSPKATKNEKDTADAYLRNIDSFERNEREAKKYK